MKATAQGGLIEGVGFRSRVDRGKPFSLERVNRVGDSGIELGRHSDGDEV